MKRRLSLKERRSILEDNETAILAAADRWLSARESSFGVKARREAEDILTGSILRWRSSRDRVVR